MLPEPLRAALRIGQAFLPGKPQSGRKRALQPHRACAESAVTEVSECALRCAPRPGGRARGSGRCGHPCHCVAVARGCGVLLLAARYNGWATAPSGQQDKSVAGLAQLPKNMSTERTDPHPGLVGTAQGHARLRA